MKRPFLLSGTRDAALVAAGTALVAATYGLVRLAYGLYLPETASELHFTTTVAGAISAGSSVAYILGAAASFVAASRYARPLLICSGLTAGAGAAGMALASHTSAFACAAILSSAGAGLASPALVQVIQRNCDADVSTEAQSVVNAGTGPGLVLAGALALALLPQWRAAWVVGAATAVVAAGAVLCLDRQRQAPEPALQPMPPPAWFVSHRRVLAAALLMGTGSAAVWNYGRSLLVGSGPASTSVLAWIALGAGGTAVIATARWTSTLQPRTAWALSTAVSVLGSLALVAAADRRPVALASCLVFGWGYTAGTGALIAWTTGIDPTRAPTGTALLFVVLNLGQAFGAAGAGTMITHVGYPAAFLASAGASAVAAVLGVTARRGAPGRTTARAAATVPGR